MTSFIPKTFDINTILCTLEEVCQDPSQLVICCMKPSASQLLGIMYTPPTGITGQFFGFLLSLRFLKRKRTYVNF